MSLQTRINNHNLSSPSAVRSPSSRFTGRHLGLRTAALFFLVAATYFFAGTVSARISLEALRRDGYGMVELQRPDPNTLTVAATINGRQTHLIIDTGWSDEGITVNGDFGKVLHSPVQAVKKFGRSASGQNMVGFNKGVADVVTMGNVQMRQVPIIFGTIGALQHSYTHYDIHAGGFIGSGFLSTCSAIIDLHNLRLYLRPPGTGRRAVIGRAMKAQGLAEVPFTIINNHCLVAVEINGAPGIMFVDTGSHLCWGGRAFQSADEDASVPRHDHRRRGCGGADEADESELIPDRGGQCAGA